MLRRISALLVALAALAEQGASRSAPVRALLLWILRRAEAVAETFVGEATGSPPPFGGIALAGNGPADALRLAARFRALAGVLRTLLAGAWDLGRRPRRLRFLCAPVPSRAGRPRADKMPVPNDTS